MSEREPQFGSFKEKLQDWWGKSKLRAIIQALHGLNLGAGGKQEQEAVPEISRAVTLVPLQVRSDWQSFFRTEFEEMIQSKGKLPYLLRVVSVQKEGHRGLIFPSKRISDDINQKLDIDSILSFASEVAYSELDTAVIRDVKNSGDREYQFRHPRKGNDIKKRETVVMGKLPPFAVVASFDPDRNISGYELILPNELDDFFDNKAVESWALKPNGYAMNDENEKQTTRLRSEIQFWSQYEDLLIWRDIVERMVGMMKNDDVFKERLDSIESKRSIKGRLEAVKGIAPKNTSTRMRSLEQGRRTLRNILIDLHSVDISHQDIGYLAEKTYSEMWLEESLRCLEKTNSQKDFLLAQIILKAGFYSISPRMIDKIARISPIFRALFDMLYDVAGADKNKLQIGSLQDLVENPVLLNATDEDWKESLESKLGELGFWLNDVDWRDGELFEEELRDIFDPTVSRRRPAVNYDFVKDLDNLALLVKLFFGISCVRSSGGECKPSDINSNPNNRWRAIRKVISSLEMSRIRRMVIEANSRMDKTVFYSILRNKQIAGHPVTVEQRTKTYSSMFRKILERGKDMINTELPEKIADIPLLLYLVTDFEGLSIELNDDSGFEGVGEVVKAILDRYSQLDKFKVLSLRFDNYDEYGKTIENWFGKHLKKEGIPKSAASNPPHKWVKFVVRGKTYDGKWVQREFQIFEKGQREIKEVNDRLYSKKRILTSPPGRFPLAYVLWGAVLNAEIYRRIKESVESMNAAL